MIEIIMRHHFTFIGMAKIWRADKGKWSKDVKHLELSYTDGGGVDGATTLEKNLWNSSKIKRTSSLSPTRSPETSIICFLSPHNLS